MKIPNDGFFDSYVDESNGDVWVKKDEKNELIDSGQPFRITGLSIEDTQQYGERWRCEIELDGQSRLMGFSCDSVESRDRMFKALEKWLDDGKNAPPLVKLTRVNRSILVVNADA